MISSANSGLVSRTPLVFIPAVMFILMEISSKTAVNLTSDNMSPWQTPFMILIFALSFSVLTCAVSSVYVSLMMLMYFSCTSCFPSASKIRPSHSQQKPCRVECWTPQSFWVLEWSCKWSIAKMPFLHTTGSGGCFSSSVLLNLFFRIFRNHL